MSNSCHSCLLNNFKRALIIENWFLWLIMAQSMSWWSARTPSSFLGEHLDNPTENILCKMIIFQGFLSEFSKQQVRQDFVSGKLGSDMNSHILTSIDGIRDIMQPRLSSEADINSNHVGSALRGLKFFSSLFRGLAKKPTDNLGKDLPVDMTFKEWHDFFTVLSSNKYWDSTLNCSSSMEKLSSPYSSTAVGISAVGKESRGNRSRLNRPFDSVAVKFSRFSSTTGSSPPEIKGCQSSGASNNREKYRIFSCTWCHRKGHRRYFCWERAGLCTRCGGDHERRFCVRQTNRVLWTPTCPLCSGGHLGKNCPTKSSNRTTAESKVHATSISNSSSSVLKSALSNPVKSWPRKSDAQVSFLRGSTGNIGETKDASVGLRQSDTPKADITALSSLAVPMSPRSRGSDLIGRDEKSVWESSNGPYSTMQRSKFERDTPRQATSIASLSATGVVSDHRLPRRYKYVGALTSLFGGDGS